MTFKARKQHAHKRENDVRKSTAKRLKVYPGSSAGMLVPEVEPPPDWEQQPSGAKNLQRLNRSTSTQRSGSTAPSKIENQRNLQYFSNQIRSQGFRCPPWPRGAENRPKNQRRVYLRIFP